MNINELRKSLELAIDIAVSAGKNLADKQEDSKVVVSSIGHDIKIMGDTINQVFILDRLSSESRFPVISEELTNQQPREEYYWVVDPLDGSLNFSRSLPLYCISIALMHGRSSVLGVIYDPVREEIFSGGPELGAWLNGKKIGVSAVACKQEAVVCTGFPSLSDFSDDKLRLFVSGVQEFKKVRLLGSAALSLAYVACGRADFYHEDGIWLWDVGAGMAIVEGAGGKTWLREYWDNSFQMNVKASNDNLAF